jgi:hypothetical protein
MKSLTMAGMALIGLGIVVLLLGRFSYTTQKNVIEVGPITASVSEKHNINVPDIAGIGAILAGGLLIYLGRKTA